MHRWGRLATQQVGSGKTLLMDAFYRAVAAAALAVPGAPQQQQQQQAPGHDMQPTPEAAPPQALAATMEQRQGASGPFLATGGAAPQEVGTSNSKGNRQGRGLGSRTGRVPAAAQRTHFHAFMLDVHKRLHDLHQRVPRVAATSRQGLPVYRFGPALLLSWSRQ